MTAILLKSFKQRIKEYKLLPSRGGCFELTVNGQLLYSKLATGVFPDDADMLDAVTDKLKGK